VSLSVPWAELALAAWLCGAVVFLAWRWVNYRRMRGDLLAQARPVGEVGQIRLVETPAVSAPVAFGVIDKVVALPMFFMALEDRAARDLAIAHELAHHRGRDLAANILAQPILALHWFNPLAWIGWRAMRRDQEAACDARVLAGRDRGERARYAGLIADMAAGPRLALAAPMACPMAGGLWGERSIIHRLRSLSMSEVPNSRRRLGRWLVAGGALALPLTASVSYAAPAQDVEAVPVAPSSAPEAPLPPAPPEPGLPPAAPDAPMPPEVPAERHVQRFVLQHGDDDDGNAEDGQPAKSERRMFVFNADGPLSPEQEKRFEEMRKEWEKKGAEWRKMGEEQRKMALALAANMPEVSTDCDKAGSEGARSWTDDSGRKHVVICERIIRDHARMAERQARLALPHAAMSLRGARAMIANNEDISDSVKREVLADLDREIARLESEQK
jgi:hypothetical protein